MKLAEALIQRKDLSSDISDLKTRITNNSLVQEGTEPAEDPEALLLQLYDKLKRFESLVSRINYTNAITKLDYITLNEALTKRDVLQLTYTNLSSISNHASSTVSRYSKTEILNKATIDVQKMRKKLDKIAEERRKLETKIQSANWTIDLL
ncbi:hypothetical protein AYI70_g10917 [Smittium culicis]|uniref:Septicolysin n=1 Tax=Smittium culicis TaxID=133412 RepID=A0A1R1X4B8_9FUNG|nr:hypothetical protein AYI70_g10917 [Smittium culicis]